MAPQPQEQKLILSDPPSEHRVIITSDEHRVNDYLFKGWKIKSVTAQNLVGASQSIGSVKGDFCFVIEKLIE